MNEDNDYDIIVVGGGGAGMTAAIMAADAGARVALLEAGEKLGGSTALSGGFVYAADTQQQAEQGISDSIESMVADILAINGDSSPEPVVRAVSSEARIALNWLSDLGVSFPTERLTSPNGVMLARSHEPDTFGAGIVERLDYEVSRRAIDVAYNSRVEKLQIGADGNVCGVITAGAAITAGAVILACGGIGGDPELLQRMEPKSKRCGDWVWHVGCETNRGDGLRMAEMAGAQIAGEDSGLFPLTPNFNHDLEVIGPDWVLMINSAGERIVREDAAYWETSEAVEAQPEGRAFCIFNRSSMLAAQPDPRVLEALAAGTITLSWVPRVLQEKIDGGLIQQAESLAALATIIGVDGEALETTVHRYNQIAHRGEDPDFGKNARSLLPLDEPPYYAAEVRPAVAIVMGAGPAIDECARVIKGAGQPITGLYAAGETTGNVYGRHYVGSGYAIASALSLARIAGREAARHTQRNTNSAPQR